MGLDDFLFACQVRVSTAQNEGTDHASNESRTRHLVFLSPYPAEQLLRFTRLLSSDAWIHLGLRLGRRIEAGRWMGYGGKSSVIFPILENWGGIGHCSGSTFSWSRGHWYSNKCWVVSEICFTKVHPCKTMYVLGNGSLKCGADSAESISNHPAIPA